MRRRKNKKYKEVFRGSNIEEHEVLPLLQKLAIRRLKTLIDDYDNNFYYARSGQSKERTGKQFDKFHKELVEAVRWLIQL